MATRWVLLSCRPPAAVLTPTQAMLKRERNQKLAAKQSKGSTVNQKVAAQKAVRACGQRRGAGKESGFFFFWKGVGVKRCRACSRVS